MSNKIINTPNLLASKFGVVPSLDPTPPSTSKVKYESVTDEGIKTQKLAETTPQPAKNQPLPSSPTPTPLTPTPESDYSGDYVYETRPNKYKFTNGNYNRKSRKDKKRSLSSVQAIVLHHTAMPSFKDKCKTIFDTSFKGSYKSSHAVMDGNGHIEYMIPIEYVANTQGIIYTDKYPNANPKGISIEIQNLGWVTKQDKKQGIQYYGRGTGIRKNALSEDEVSRVYDYDLNVIKGKKYKGQRYFEEYSLAQTEALAQWIKEMLKSTGINWKFTKETYKQMFPNKQKPELPLKHLVEKNILFVAFKKSSKGPILGRGKYGGWGISEDFYKGVRGVYTHCSITQDKIDIGPTYNIIKMLKTHFS